MGRSRKKGKRKKENNSKKEKISKVSCGSCDAILLAKPNVIARHYLREHQIELSEKQTLEIIANRKVGNDRKVYQCRKCGVTFPRLDYFKRHYRDKHQKKIATSSSNCNSPDLVQDPEIKQYIEQNPDQSGEMGKFGVPQDPYRYGFFGSGSMEYDSWRKDK